MKKRTQRTRFSLWGYLIFFFTVLFIILVSVLFYSLLTRLLGRNFPLVLVSVLATSLFFAAVCAIIDFFRRKYMVEQPVRAILEATARIAEGDFSVRTEPRHEWGHYDEFDVILENISKMAAELSATELLRSDFVANVSHEMRTPLAVLYNYAQLLQAEGVCTEEGRAYARVIAQESRRLSRLTSDILRLSKLESRGIRPQLSRVDLSESLRLSVLRAEERIEDKGLSLTCEIEEANILSDGSLLELIWDNLLSNAVKFTSEGGISVTLRREGAGAAVCVRDTGAGIDAETGKHIFDKFYQGDKSHAQEGNGLGLALVRRVVDILGCEISVESEAGKGSAFTVRFREVLP